MNNNSFNLNTALGNTTIYREDLSDLFEEQEECYFRNLSNWSSWGPNWNFSIYMDDTGNWQSNEVSRDQFNFIHVELPSYL